MPREAWARWLGSNDTQSFCCGLLVVQSASATPSTSLMAAASAASAGSGDGAAVGGAAVAGTLVDVGGFVEVAADAEDEVVGCSSPPLQASVAVQR